MLLFSGTRSVTVKSNLYDGEQCILESEVHPLDSDVSGVIRGSYGEESLERRRDILRQVEGRGNILIVGIENQSHIHYAMPLRTITYDVLGYISEAKEIASQRKKQRNEKDIQESANEFLFGFGKEDRLTPIMTIILYYGEEPWEGPRSLHEMLMDMPEKFKEYIPNCRLNIVELNSDKIYDFHNEELKLLFDISRVFLQGDKEALEQYEEISIDSELADILGTIIKSKFIIQQSETEGEVKMCTMLDEMEREAETRGEERGEARGEIRLVYKKLQKNKSTAVIADELEEDLAVIEMMISTIQKHAPDYDINAITTDYQENFKSHN